MIINIAHTKGGVGKTTIAVNLALTMGANLFDMDTQHSSYEFSLISETPKPIHFWTDIEMAAELIQQYHDDPKKHLIVDSGGYDSRTSREFMMNSNIIVTPLTVSQFEFLGLQNFDNLVIHGIRKANPKIKAFALLNNINYFDQSDADQLEEIILQNLPDYKVLKTRIGYRKSFKQATAVGKSVVEYQKNSAAAKEIIALAKEIEGICEAISKEK